MNSPETRPSLLLRVRDTADHEAWDEFSAIYRPVICRLAVYKGMQEADAEDLAQQVLLAIANAIGRWQPDSSRAKFRTWLRRISENAILNALTRGVPDKASGDNEARMFLEQKPAARGPDSDLLRIEYRREVFNWAAQQIRDEFSHDTWQSFWLTTVEDTNIDLAARQLNKTRGSVYASRSRVMKRLKQKVEEFDQ
jgi:RNA polymerase sigma-70 factor (ECF subfamily)